jgi:RNA polymerase sigma-70 factor (ECF subfamily)
VHELLTSDARAMTDAGGEFRAALRPIRGREKVSRFMLKLVEKYGPPVSVSWHLLNGLPAVVVEYGERGARTASRFVLLCGVDATGRISELYVVMASAKLTALRA